MKTGIKTILIVIMLLAAAGQAFAYPPDNAAVLYYKAFMLLEEPNDAVGWMLSDLQKGNIDLNEQIRRYVERNRSVIKDVVAAAEIRNCDWGLDFSEGLELMMPQLAKSRRMAYILAADAKVLDEKGDYKTALERCITINKVGGHVGDDTLISYLVGTAVKEIANKCIADILSKMSEDLETLAWLQSRTIVASRTLSIENALANEAEVTLREIRRERIEVILEQTKNDPNVKNDPNAGAYRALVEKAIEQIRRTPQEDEAFFEKIREYYTGFMASVQSAFKLPYPQAYEELMKLCEKADKDVNEQRPEAVIFVCLGYPAVIAINSNRVQRETSFNALRAAIGIYIVKAKTGKLPDELPAGLPKDMFSGKDFLYEKTDAGFILKCQGKNLTRNIIHQYEFKVAK